MQNLWDNSDAATLEIYEDTLWRLENNNLGVLDSSQDSTGRTMGQWRDVLETRRPRAQLHRHVFSYVAGGDNHHKYVHGSKCAGNSGAMGTVVVLP